MMYGYARNLLIPFMISSQKCLEYMSFIWFVVKTHIRIVRRFIVISIPNKCNIYTVVGDVSNSLGQTFG